MLEWFIANTGTILAGLVLLFLVAGIIRSLVKDKKKGKSTCGNICSHCAIAGKCHQISAENKND